MDADEITPHIAAIVLWHFNGAVTGAHPPSQGEKRLLDAACGIDSELQAKLALGFPGLVAAVRVAQIQGCELLRRVVKDNVAVAVPA